LLCDINYYRKLQNILGSGRNILNYLFHSLTHSLTHSCSQSFFLIKRICDNIYIGYGHKHLSLNYSPPALPQLEMEYPIDKEIEEMDDPTAEEGERELIMRDEGNDENLSDNVNVNENQ
jgi:Radial spokehead-like protein